MTAIVISLTGFAVMLMINGVIRELKELNHVMAQILKELQRRNR